MSPVSPGGRGVPSSLNTHTRFPGVGRPIEPGLTIVPDTHTRRNQHTLSSTCKRSSQQRGQEYERYNREQEQLRTNCRKWSKGGRGEEEEREENERRGSGAEKGGERERTVRREERREQREYLESRQGRHSWRE